MTQENSYLVRPVLRENSDPRYAGSVGDYSTVALSSTHTRVSTDPSQGPFAVTPAINDSSLTAFLDIADTSRRATRASVISMRPQSLADCPAYFSVDPYSSSWTSGMSLCTPPTSWNTLNVASMRPNRRQVPSGSTDPHPFERGRMWCDRGDAYQAVSAPAQPTLESDVDQIPAWLYSPAVLETGAHCRLTGQIEMDVEGVSSWMAQSVLNSSSLTRHRRRMRRAHVHPDRVVCDQCQKPMRRQSLKRHVREVHNRIKRHTKTCLAAEP